MRANKGHRDSMYSFVLRSINQHTRLGEPEPPHTVARDEITAYDSTLTRCPSSSPAVAAPPSPHAHAHPHRSGQQLDTLRGIGEYVHPAETCCAAPGLGFVYICCVVLPFHRFPPFSTFPPLHKRQPSIKHRPTSALFDSACLRRRSHHHGFFLWFLCDLQAESRVPRPPREALHRDGGEHRLRVCYSAGAGQDGGGGDSGVSQRREGPAGGRQDQGGGAREACRGGMYEFVEVRSRPTPTRTKKMIHATQI